MEVEDEGPSSRPSTAVETEPPLGPVRTPQLIYEGAVPAALDAREGLSRVAHGSGAQFLQESSSSGGSDSTWSCDSTWMRIWSWSAPLSRAQAR
jgi:hypothetical protein